MIYLRKAEDRGQAEHGWLHSQHTFSFADYHDEEFMGFGHLRVINEDRVEPGKGFGTHGHRDMEIVTYVISGALDHKDSMGNASTIKPHEVQRMSAGKGVLHSEFNHSQKELVHFLQIWIIPDQKNLTPSYEQKYFAPETKRDKWLLVASEDGAQGSVKIHQNARIYSSILSANTELDFKLESGRHLWIHVVKGSLSVNGHSIVSGDALAVAEEKKLSFSAGSESEVLIFDLKQ